MEIAQEIGSYAGFAAVVGLAILSALYFSQARDVKRLREWAGRAPERGPEPQGVEDTPQPPKPAQPASPAGGKPATAAAGAAAAAQARAAQPAASGAGTPAAAQAATAGQTAAARQAAAAAGKAAAATGKGPATGGSAGDAATPEGESATPAVASAAAEAKEAGGSADEDAPPATETAPSTPAPNGTGAGKAPSVPAVEAPSGTPAAATPAGRSTAPPTVPPRAPVRRSAVPRSGQIARPRSQILPSYEEVQGPTPWYRRLLASPRYLVLALVAVLVIGAAAAFGFTRLGSSGGGSETEAPSTPPNSGASGAGSPGGSNGKPAAVDASRVTVAVLNGTTVPGLAAQIGDKLEAGRFKLGNVSNSSDGGTRAESVVFFARGSEGEARAVSRRLRIAQREPIDAQTQQLAGDASVVVIAGADQTQ